MKDYAQKSQVVYLLTQHCKRLTIIIDKSSDTGSVSSLLSMQLYHHSSAACGILDCTEELFSFLCTRSIRLITRVLQLIITTMIIAMTEGLCLCSITAMSVHGIRLSLNTWTDNITLLPQTGQRKKKFFVLTFSCVISYKIECTILRTIVIEIT